MEDETIKNYQKCILENDEGETIDANELIVETINYLLVMRLTCFILSFIGSISDKYLLKG